MMPQRPDPKVIQKTIELLTKRKEALYRLIQTGVSLRQDVIHQQDPPRTSPLSEFIAAYLDLQQLELAGAEAYLNDLQEALKQAESPILQPVMRPGRG